LAKKYQVDWISKMAAAQLRKLWPTTVAGWFSIAEDENQSMIRDIVGDDAWEPFWDDNTLRLRQLPEPVSSILLARECNAISILPFAFLHLLRCHPEPDPDYVDPTRVAERTLLSPDDSHRLLLARERIGKWFMCRQYPPWDLAACESGKPCQVAILRTWLMLAKQVGRHCNILLPWTRKNSYADEMCPECKASLAAEIDALQDGFVEQLGTFFELDE